MKKLVVLCLILVLVLAGCGCEHEWKDPTCEAPKTCGLCGETEGAPLGHVWQAATCDKPKTCETCKATEGQALDHSWQEAACEAPQTCSLCKATVGVSLGHIWQEATTEAPKTCEVCQKTEGEAIHTDPRFKTHKCRDFFGTWEGQMEVPGEMFGLSAEKDLSCIAYMVCEFRNDGTYSMTVSYEETSYIALVREVTIYAMYEVLAQQGLTEADFIAQYGVDIPTYVDQQIADMDVNDSTTTTELVYYADNGILYDSNSWDNEMNETPYALEGDTLHLTEDGMTITLHRKK